MTRVHSFELPPAQPDYRCAGCGLSFQRAGGGVLALRNGEVAVFARVDAEGWLRCLCADRRFRWLTVLH